MRNTKLFAHIVGCLVMALGLNTAWAVTAGYAQFVHGSVVVTSSDGQTRKLIKGSVVREGDTVSTARNASAQIRTQDGGFIAVRPDTELKFDSFQYTGKQGAPEKSFFSLFKGGFRAVTGLIGRVRKNDYRIKTPAATIGIRGTDHETFVMTTDLQAANAGMEVGTYNMVNVGKTQMVTEAGALTIGPNQVGFVASPLARPTLLPSLPSIFQMPAPSTGEANTKDKDKGSSSDGDAQQASEEPEPDPTASPEGGDAQQANGESEPDSTASAEGGDVQQANGAQDQGGDQPVQQAADAESADGGAAPVPAIRETAAVDSSQKVAQVSPAATSPASAQQEGAVTAAAAPPPVTTSVQATSGSLTLDTTAQTVTSGNTTVSVSSGVYAAQAQTAADDAALAAQAAATAVTAATSSSNTLLAITTVNTATASSAITTASTAITANTTTVNSATNLTPADAAAANANASTAQTAATTAATIASTANAAFTANGTFADVTAAPANTAVQTANAAVASANTSVQNNATTVVNQNSALASAQTAASAALTAANAGVATANAALTSANTQNSNISQAQSGASILLSTAQNAAAAAAAAAQAAQTAADQAATLQAAGDLTGAAAQFAIAQDQLAIAQSERAIAVTAQTTLAQQLAAAQTAQTQATAAVNSATSSANAAATAAATALSEANAASTAAANAANALTVTATQLAALQSSASTMAADAVVAAYNNPAVASSNFMGHLEFPEPVTGGFNLAQENMSPVQANTQYVLDGSGNLVEMRSSSFQSQPMQGTATTSIADANITWSGGTPADTFSLADNSIYAGRWVNSTVTVTDNTNTANSFTYSPAGSLWAVLNTPAVGYVQSLVGTTAYTLAGATSPFDTVGNVGALNSATLAADFTAQIVNAVINLTMPAASGMAGTYVVTANNMPINTVASGSGNGGFGGNITPVVSCSGTCADVNYSANVGGSFAGAGAASAGLGYDIWPTVSAGLPAPNLIQGLAAFTAATPPTTPPPAAYIANNIAVETSGGMGYSSGSIAAPADLVYVAGGTSTSGALSSWTLRDLGGGSNWVQTASTSGGTATSADAPSFATTGIQYGEWTGYTGQSMSWSQDLGGMFGGAPTNWMYGPTGYVDAAYAPLTTGGPLTGAMAGTFTYQLDGATAPQSQHNGLTGTLNSATVTADFVNMLVSGALDITMPGSENWGATVSNAPISLGMGALTTNAVVTYGLGVPATTCATCSGSVSANFTGQNLAGVILSYNLYNNTQNGGGDVYGSAALTRNYAGNTNPMVTDGTPVAPTTIEVALGGQNGGGIMNYPIASSTTTGNLLTAFGSSGPGYVDSTIVTCVTCTTNASGQVATSGIYYGTWDAGSYSQSYSSTFTAGSMPPSYWITGPEAGPLFLPQALTGTASYAFDAGQVSNAMGVAGVVNGTTTLSLDFGKQTVGVNLDFTVNDTATPTPVSHAWNIATVPGQEAVLGNGMGISSAGFTASTYGGGGGTGMLAVTVDAGATPLNLYGANVNGQLTGAGLTGAIISFNVNAILNPATTPTFETVNGVAAFTGTAQSVTTPHRYVSISLADPFMPIPQPTLGFYANSTTRALQDVSGNLTAFDTQIVSNNGGGSSSAVANINATLTDYGTDAISGISWGRWAGGSFSVTDRQTGTATTVDQTINNTSLHWIAETATTSATTLPSTGTYTYTQAGGTLPTDSLGNVGAAPATATLTADFSALTVNLGVSATVAGTTLSATGANVPIIQKTVFYASSQEPVGSTSHLSVSCTGACAAATGAGVVIGKFSGAGATGAAMTYGLQNGTTTISGVAAMHQ